MLRMASVTISLTTHHCDYLPTYSVYNKDVTAGSWEGVVAIAYQEAAVQWGCYDPQRCSGVAV
jgi:hypothetical protein